MTFSIPRPNVIESDEGFSVEAVREGPGLVSVRYTEAGRVFSIEAKFLTGPYLLVIYPISIKDEASPKETVALDAAERMQISENIRAAFGFRGYEIQIA
jgi:hypothetical protein